MRWGVSFAAQADGGGVGFDVADANVPAGNADPGTILALGGAVMGVLGYVITSRL